MPSIRPRPMPATRWMCAAAWRATSRSGFSSRVRRFTRGRCSTSSICGPTRPRCEQAAGNLQQSEADLEFARQQVSLLQARSQPGGRPGQPGEGPAGLRTHQAAGGAGRRAQAGSRRRRGRAARRRSQSCAPTRPTWIKTALSTKTQIDSTEGQVEALRGALENAKLNLEYGTSARPSAG